METCRKFNEFEHVVFKMHEQTYRHADNNTWHLSWEQVVMLMSMVLSWPSAGVYQVCLMNAVLLFVK